jgi:hypothetical protein
LKLVTAASRDTAGKIAAAPDQRRCERKENAQRSRPSGTREESMRAMDDQM